jgi:hypothetical protein
MIHPWKPQEGVGLTPGSKGDRGVCRGVRHNSRNRATAVGYDDAFIARNTAKPLSGQHVELPYRYGPHVQNVTQKIHGTKFCTHRRQGKRT